MSIYNNLLEIHKTQAQVEHLQEQTKVESAKGQLYQEQAKALVTKEAVDAQTRAALQALEMAKAQTGPNAPDPNAPAPVDPIDESIQTSAADVKKYNAQADAIARAGGDPEDLARARTAAVKAQENLYHQVNTQLAQKQDKANKVSQFAQSVAPMVSGYKPGIDGEDTDAAVRTAVKQMDALTPGWSKNAMLDRNLMGDVIPGAKTAAAFDQTARAGVKTSDQLRDAQEKIKAKMTADRDAYEKVKEQGRMARTASTVALGRDGLAQRATEHDDRMNAKVVDQELKRAQLEARGVGGKGEKYKTPAKSAVDALAVNLQGEFPGLSLDDAKVAAKEYDRKVFDLLKENADEDDYGDDEARADALEWVTARVKPGAPAVKNGLFKADTPAVKPRYSVGGAKAKEPAKAEGAPAAAPAVDLDALKKKYGVK